MINLNYVTKDTKLSELESSYASTEACIAVYNCIFKHDYAVTVKVLDFTKTQGLVAKDNFINENITRFITDYSMVTEILVYHSGKRDKREIVKIFAIINKIFFNGDGRYCEVRYVQ